MDKEQEKKGQKNNYFSKEKGKVESKGSNPSVEPQALAFIPDDIEKKDIPDLSRLLGCG